MQAVDRARLLLPVVVALSIVSGCDITRTVVGGPGPIPAGPVGPVVENLNGGPRVECRGIPITECQQSAPNPERADVIRVIITCTKVCTPLEGEFRIDLVTANGAVEQAGGGAYAAAPAQAPSQREPVP